MANMNNKEKFFLFFDAGSKQLILSTQEESIIQNANREVVLIKEVFLGPNDRYIGDYDTGKVVDVYVKPLIDEKYLKYKKEKQKSSLYPIEKRIDIIIDLLSKNETLVKTEQFTEMVNILNKYDKTLQVKLNAMKKNAKNLTICPYEEEVYISKLNE